MPPSLLGRAPHQLLATDSPLFGYAGASDNVSFDILPLLLFAVFFWLAVPFMTAVHEGGHAIIGRLVGYEIVLVRIGLGQKSTRFMVGSATFEIGWPLVGGLTWGVPRHRSVAREAVFSLAGILAELLAVMLVWVTVSADWTGPLRWALLASAVLSAITNLWPRTVFYRTYELSSDGRQLLDLLQDDASQLDSADPGLQIDLLKAFLAMEAEDAERGLEFASRAMERDPANPDCTAQYGTALIFNGRWREGYDVLCGASSLEDATPVLCNNAATAALMTFDETLLSEVDRLSEKAITGMPDHSVVVATRTAALVLLGRQAEAIALDATPKAPGLTAQQKAMNTAFLALAHHELGDHDKAGSLLLETKGLDPDCAALDEIQRRIATE